MPAFPYSGVLVFPIIIPPADLILSTEIASSSAIISAGIDPNVHRIFFTGSRSFIGIGIPCRGPKSLPFITASSASFAFFKEPAWSRVI